MPDELTWTRSCVSSYHIILVHRDWRPSEPDSGHGKSLGLSRGKPVKDILNEREAFADLLLTQTGFPLVGKRDDPASEKIPKPSDRETAHVFDQLLYHRTSHRHQAKESVQ